ncbi:hypothetical protein SAMN02745866_04309 [Alteromonadaceae bacterium Bs31]|nr:hypothetical protein SAMN02745866_04309 [Alteromonadaceae bacterium Bs31]
MLDRHKDITQGVALGLLSIAWVFIIGKTISEIENYDPIVIVRIVTLLTVFAGVVVAAYKLVNDQVFRQSESYLMQAKDLFEKAYRALSPENEIGYPLNSRLRWLTSARILRSALSLEYRISDESHKYTYNEYRFYWHTKFYEILRLGEHVFPDKSYFYKEGKLHIWGPGDQEPLNEESIAELYRFAKWPEGREDRMEPFSESERNKIHEFGPKGLSDYLNEIHKS